MPQEDLPKLTEHSEQSSDGAANDNEVCLDTNASVSCTQSCTEVPQNRLSLGASTRSSSSNRNDVDGECKVSAPKKEASKTGTNSNQHFSETRRSETHPSFKKSGLTSCGRTTSRNVNDGCLDANANRYSNGVRPNYKNFLDKSRDHQYQMSTAPSGHNGIPVNCAMHCPSWPPFPLNVPPPMQSGHGRFGHRTNSCNSVPSKFDFRTRSHSLPRSFNRSGETNDLPGRFHNPDFEPPRVTRNMERSGVFNEKCQPRRFSERYDGPDSDHGAAVSSNNGVNYLCNEAWPQLRRDTRSQKGKRRENKQPRPSRPGAWNGVDSDYRNQSNGAQNQSRPSVPDPTSRTRGRQPQQDVPPPIPPRRHGHSVAFNTESNSGSSQTSVGTVYENVCLAANRRDTRYAYNRIPIIRSQAYETTKGKNDSTTNKQTIDTIHETTDSEKNNRNDCLTEESGYGKSFHSDVKKEMARARQINLPVNFDKKEESNDLNPEANSFEPRERVVDAFGNSYTMQRESKGVYTFHPKSPPCQSNPKYVIPASESEANSAYDDETFHNDTHYNTSGPPRNQTTHTYPSRQKIDQHATQRHRAPPVQPIASQLPYAPYSNYHTSQAIPKEFEHPAPTATNRPDVAQYNDNGVPNNNNQAYPLASQFQYVPTSYQGAPIGSQIVPQLGLHNGIQSAIITGTQFIPAQFQTESQIDYHTRRQPENEIGNQVGEQYPIHQVGLQPGIAAPVAINGAYVNNQPQPIQHIYHHNPQPAANIPMTPVQGVPIMTTVNPNPPPSIPVPESVLYQPPGYRPVYHNTHPSGPVFQEYWATIETDSPNPMADSKDLAFPMSPSKHNTADTDIKGVMNKENLNEDKLNKLTREICGKFVQLIRRCHNTPNANLTDTELVDKIVNNKLFGRPPRHESVSKNDETNVLRLSHRRKNYNSQGEEEEDSERESEESPSDKDSKR